MLRVRAFAQDWARRHAELIPPGFSLIFGITIDATTGLILIGSMLQRPSADLPAAGVAAAFTALPMLLVFVSGIGYKPVLVWVGYVSAGAVLLFATSTPVANDFAPLLLVLMTGNVAGLTRTLWVSLTFASAAAVLVAAWAAHRLDGLPLYLSVLAFGWLIGYLLRTQAQLLVKQQELQADLAEHAAADERRRIAREVHDVIAHSLSVTLLHVTGARHALQQDRDVDDAVDALTDAERLGRQAMADIRRTVGLLEDGPAGTAPEPGVADLRDLVADFVRAGMRVSLASTGSLDHVSAAAGLALYRIAQESLANIAKHAPDSKATVVLDISLSFVRLSIINELPVAVTAASGGRGLTGMRQRAELLGGVVDAGPCQSGWSVHAQIPLGDPGPSWCPLK